MCRAIEPDNSVKIGLNVQQYFILRICLFQNLQAIFKCCQGQRFLFWLSDCCFAKEIDESLYYFLNDKLFESYYFRYQIEINWHNNRHKCLLGVGIGFGSICQITIEGKVFRLELFLLISLILKCLYQILILSLLRLKQCLQLFVLSIQQLVICGCVLHFFFQLSFVLQQGFILGHIPQVIILRFVVSLSQLPINTLLDYQIILKEHVPVLVLHELQFVRQLCCIFCQLFYLIFIHFNSIFALSCYFINPPVYFKFIIFLQLFFYILYFLFAFILHIFHLFLEILFLRYAIILQTQIIILKYPKLFLKFINSFLHIQYYIIFFTDYTICFFQFRCMCAILIIQFMFIEMFLSFHIIYLILYRINSYHKFVIKLTQIITFFICCQPIVRYLYTWLLLNLTRYPNSMVCIYYGMSIWSAYGNMRDVLYMGYNYESKFQRMMIGKIQIIKLFYFHCYSISNTKAHLPKYLMFKKIRENSPFNPHNEFLRSFGLDCLEKIKSIQFKLNKMDWETDKCRFQDVVPKVKSVLDAYQIIAYQIFDSLQSTQLDDLAHSILKMFLQISSATKWLIKGFTTSMGKNVTIVQKVQNEQKNSRQSQTQHFRKKQISRFILRELKEKYNTEETQQQKDDSSDQNSNSLFGSNKQKFQNSKNKLMSINSSNAPIILQDAVESFTKKSQYIDKFIALRQNYEGAFRYQQPLTSQAIIEEQMLARNSLAAEKFKQFCAKLMSFQISKKVAKFQYGIQVTPIISASEKIKKAAQKTKIKLLLEEIDRQKQANKQLKLQIEIYEKKLSLSLKQNQQLEIIKKKASLSSSKYYIRRPERQNIKTQDHEDEQSGTKEDAFDNLKSTKNFHEQQTFRRKNINAFRKTNSAKQLKFGSQTSMKYLAASEESIQGFKMDLQVYNIQIENKGKTFKRIVTEKSIPRAHISEQKSLLVLKQQKNSLTVETNVYNFQIGMPSNAKSLNHLMNKKHIQSQQLKGMNKIINNDGEGKLIRFNNSKRNLTPDMASNFTNTPMSIIGQFTQNELVTRRNRQMTAKTKSRNGIYLNKRINAKNLSMQCFLFQNKLMKFHDPLDVKVPFQTLYRSKQIKSISITQETICQFFIDQNNAKNYQLLNVSELCNIHKKVKLPNRRVKASTEVGSLSLSSSLSSAAFKKIRTSNTQNQNMAQNIIAKSIFTQFLNTKKLNKQIYLKLILFIRYPYSFVFRNGEIIKRVNQSEQNLIDLAQIQSHLKRIWSIHSRCNITNDVQNTKKWCEHKKFIVQFFGYQPIQEDQKNSIFAADSS